MAESEGWNHGAPADTRPHPQIQQAALAGSVPRRVSADSFRALVARLQSPAAIHVSHHHKSAPRVESEHSPQAPVAVETAILPDVPALPSEPPELRLETQTAEPASPEPASPESASPDSVSPDAIELVTVQEQPKIAEPESPLSEDDALGALETSEPVVVTEFRAPQGVNLPPILPPPLRPEPPPVLSPPQAEAQSAAPIEPAQELARRQRSQEDFDLEIVMRQIAAIPSAEDRLQFLDEAAALIAEEQIRSRPKGDLAQIEDRFMESMTARTVERNAVAAEAVTEPVAGEQEAPSRTYPDPTPIETVPAVEPNYAGTSWTAPLDTGVNQVEEYKLRKAFEVVTEPAPSAGYGNLEENEASELARSLLDMMAASAGGGQPHERALAADTLLRLVPSLPTKPLMLLADRLSIMESPPPLLVARLIRDERIEVSGPLLENSPHVIDQDLIQVINEGTSDHKRLIARRRKLSRMISDKLIATREPPVLLTLVRNAHAEISHDGFVMITEYASHDREIMAPLCTREDLPAPFAFELFWSAPIQLRRYLLSRFLTDSETLTKILKITLATQGGDPQADKGFPPPEMVERAVHLFAAGDAKSADELFGDILDVEPATVARILGDMLGEPVVILLKAAGCTRNDFAAHLESLRRSDFASIASDRKPDELHALFDSMSFNKARILLTYWDWATRKSGPYAPIN